MIPSRRLLREQGVQSNTSDVYGVFKEDTPKAIFVRVRRSDIVSDVKTSLRMYGTSRCF